MRNWLLCCLLGLISGTLPAQDFVLTATDKATTHELSANGDGDVCLTISGIASGDYYEIYLNENRIEQRFEFGALPAGATGIHADYTTGIGNGEMLNFCIASESDYPEILHLSVRTTPALTTEKVGRIVTTPSTDANFLLNTVFRDESCFELSPIRLVSGDNVLSSGQRATQTGTFSNGADLIGMDRGIILTTGFAHQAPGPNSVIPASGSYPGSPTTIDADAQVLVGPTNAYFDVAVLEFTFVPTTDTITFDYVFFSEEYCFAIDAAFGNDGFAFFLDGPMGRRNIARLPSGEVISAATLNHIETPDLFIDNTPVGSFDPCTNLPIPPEQLDGINYDGFSVKMTAKAAVTPCEVHTLKLMVVDSGDPSSDSGVFLEAGVIYRRPHFQPYPVGSGGGGGTELRRRLRYGFPDLLQAIH